MVNNWPIIALVGLIFIFVLLIKFRKRNKEKYLYKDIQVDRNLLEEILNNSKTYIGYLLYIEDEKHEDNYLCMVFQDENKVILSLNYDLYQEFYWDLDVIKENNNVDFKKHDYLMVEIRDYESFIDWTVSLCTNKLGITRANVMW